MPIYATVEQVIMPGGRDLKEFCPTWTTPNYADMAQLDPEECGVVLLYWANSWHIIDQYANLVYVKSRNSRDAIQWLQGYTIAIEKVDAGVEGYV